MLFENDNEKTGLSSAYASKLRAADKRLRMAVSYSGITERTVYKTFASHSSKINTKFRTSGLLMDLWRLCAFYENVPVYAVMDAVGALTNGEWRRLKKGFGNFIDYELNLYEGFYDAMRLNMPPGRKERNKEAAGFIKFIDSLSGNTRKAIIGGTPFRLSDLPEPAKKSLQSTMQALFDFTNKDDAEAQRIDFSKVDKAKITLKTSKSIEDKSRYSEYGIDVDMESFQFFFTVDNYEEKKAEYEKMGRSVNIEDEEKLPALYFLDYHVEKDFIRRKQAIKLEMMNQIVSVSGQNLNMPLVLTYLLERYKINSICDTPINTPAKNVNLPAGPLWKILDVICEQLGKWQWECRATGMLVLRDPTNPYRRQEL